MLGTLAMFGGQIKTSIIVGTSSLRTDGIYTCLFYL